MEMKCWNFIRTIGYTSGIPEGEKLLKFNPLKTEAEEKFAKTACLRLWGMSASCSQQQPKGNFPTQSKSEYKTKWNENHSHSDLIMKTAKLFNSILWLTFIRMSNMYINSCFIRCLANPITKIFINKRKVHLFLYHMNVETRNSSTSLRPTVVCVSSLLFIFNTIIYSIHIYVSKKSILSRL